MAPTSKRGHGKPAEVTRQEVEEQVLPKDFTYMLSGGKRIKVSKLTMGQLKELDLDFSILRNEDGSYNLANAPQLALCRATDIAAAAAGLTLEETDSLPADDVVGIASKVLISMTLENAAVMNFFAHVGITRSLLKGEIPGMPPQGSAG